MKWINIMLKFCCMFKNVNKLLKFILALEGLFCSVSAFKDNKILTYTCFTFTNLSHLTIKHKNFNAY